MQGVTSITTTISTTTILATTVSTAKISTTTISTTISITTITTSSYVPNDSIKDGGPNDPEGEEAYDISNRRQIKQPNDEEHRPSVNETKSRKKQRSPPA